ncbi:DUF4159 domain-containing protein [Candidatus Fermentibacteria bacterium]|nr:DUF4159 domain-containing protein [Candidatus Fermentibacteria bacterium]
MCVLLLALLLGAVDPGPAPFTIGRVKYGGGGDWYADPSSLPNLLRRIGDDLGIAVAERENVVELSSADLFRHPFLYLTGHGEIRLTDDEVSRLHRFLLGGGFLHADDNYGMDASFRREIARVFPDRDLVVLPPDHPIFSIHHVFPQGVPKIHEHDGAPAQALAVMDGERIMVVYTFSCDLGDGWEDERVHNDPPYLREAALKMGVNIVAYALTH